MKWRAFFLLLCLASCADPLEALSEPLASRPYKRIVISEVHRVWGLNAPVAVAAGQLEQESSWNKSAVSCCAAGLAQFTSETAAAISKSYPDRLGSGDVFNPTWAVRALVTYDRDLGAGMAWAETSCDRWGFTLSAYNGGTNMLDRERELCNGSSGCDANAWFNNVERKRYRGVSAYRENRHYVRAIIFSTQAHYLTWGPTVECKQ